MKATSGYVVLLSSFFSLKIDFAKNSLQTGNHDKLPPFNFSSPIFCLQDVTHSLTHKYYTHED